MRANMVLDHFRHQSGHCPPCASNQVHDLFAARLAIECAFNGLHLAPEAADTGQQLLFIADSMGHRGTYTLAPYPTARRGNSQAGRPVV
jgi:hypothetical protein